jgi:phosphohistidine swiveling domain-containing protein
MDALVLPLETPAARDPRLVGGKAAALARLVGAGFPVPAGVVVTTATFVCALAGRRAHLGAIFRGFDLRDPAQAAQAAEACRDVLADLAVPDEAAVALADALPTIAPGDAVAVRSSATAEDRADVSFAGQYETVLGVRGADALRQAILTCWRSFFSANALVARAAAGAAGEDEAMAVVVQRMVDAECAGVAFSVDPVSARRDLVAIDATWGLGLGAVEGSVRADTCWVYRDTFDLHDRRVVEKPERIGLGEGCGVRRIPVDEPLRRAACLPDAWARRVAQAAVAAEGLFGSAQDIEWAVAGGKLWVLQSRAVTTLAAETARARPFPVEWASDGERRAHWVLPPRFDQAVLAPLEEEAALIANEALREGMRHNGDMPLPQFGGGGRLPRWRAFNGRVYTYFEPSDLGEGDRRVRMAAAGALVARLREADVTRWEHKAPEVIGATARLHAVDREGADGPALADHVEDAFGCFRHHWFLHWIPGAMLGPRPFPDVLAAVTGLGGPALEAAAMFYAGGDDNRFTDLIDGVFALAETARRTPTVAAALLAGDGAADRLKAMPGAAPFLAQLDAFLDVHGYRTGGGFGSRVSILTPTWREQPDLVLALAAGYLRDGAEPPAAACARARAARDAQLEAVCGACADKDAVASLRRLLPHERRARADLENHNHYIDQMTYGQLRTALLAAARQLVATSVLDAVDDVFWLRRAEIGEALRAPEGTCRREVVAARRRERAAWAELEAPSVLGSVDARLDPRPPPKDEVTAGPVEQNGRLVGQPASAGRRRGRARVVAMSVLLPEVEPGDVLVAENAGPLWTPVFPVLGALVLDQGVLMQHAATTAREYGVPAVINVGNATRRIKDGDWLIVDGGAGTVDIDAASAG